MTPTRPALGGASTFRVTPFGESAVLVELEQRIDIGVAARAAAIADEWEATGHGSGVPSYAAAVLSFDPMALAPQLAEELARRLAARVWASPPPTGMRVFEIPTIYDGPDLVETAERSGLSEAHLIELHSGASYYVFFLGLMPGLAYLGGLDSRVRAPRLATPRAKVPRGSVAIIDGQSTIYPFDSPGGWRLIGRTDITVFDLTSDPPALLRPGDRVRFRAIS